MAWWDRVLHYADPRTALSAQRDILRRPTDTLRRMHSSSGIKRTTREIAAVYAPVEPYVVGTLTFLGSALFSPAVGVIIGVAATAASYNTGVLAARNEGLHGQEAREAGREQRRTVGTAAIVGTSAGTLTAIAVGALAAAPAATAGEGAALAAAEGGSAAGGVAVNTAAVGVDLAAEQSAILGTSLVTDTVIASQAPATIAAAEAGVVLTPYGAAAILPGATAASAAAAVTGGSSLLGDIVKIILPLALQRLLGFAAAAPKTTDMPLIGGGSGGGGGAPGIGDPSADEGFGTFADALKKLPTWVKVTGGVGVALAGLALGKHMKRKAA